jgi:hypothetical protein
MNRLNLEDGPACPEEVVSSDSKINREENRSLCSPAACLQLIQPI